MKFTEATNALQGAYQKTSPDRWGTPFDITSVDAEGDHLGCWCVTAPRYTGSGIVNDIVCIGTIVAAEEAEGEFEISESPFDETLVTVLPSADRILAWMHRNMHHHERAQSYTLQYQHHAAVHKVYWRDEHLRIQMSESPDLHEAVFNAMRGICGVEKVPKHTKGS